MRLRMSGCVDRGKIRVYLAFAAAIASMVVSACDSSKNPLSKPSLEAADQRLIGLWRTNREGHDMYLHLIALEPPMVKGVMITYPYNDTHVSVDAYNAYATKSGAGTYLNFDVPAADNAEKTMEFWFAKYRISSDDHLTLLLPEVDRLKRDVLSHKLSGKSWTTTWDTNIELDEPSDKLLEYFDEGNEADHFKEFATFHRVKDQDSSTKS